MFNDFVEAERFEALNTFFDRIYVLTLKRASDRQDHVRQVLRGLNYHFIYGVDKQELSMEQVVRLGLFDRKLHMRTKRTHRSMNLGEIACALSHRKIYEDIAEKGYGRSLILEDDVEPEFEILKEFPHVLKALPHDWELLMLGYHGEKAPDLFHFLQQKIYRVYRHLRLFNWHKVSQNWIDQLCLRPLNERLWEMGKLVGGYAYAVTLNTARRFTAYQTPIKLQADRVFYYQKVAEGLRAYVPREKVFTLSNLSQSSYIGYEKAFRENPS